MAHFQKLVTLFQNKILEFKDGPINIVICHLGLDSLVSAFVLKCYVLCVLGSKRHVKIFCDDELDPLLQSVCRHFNLSCSMDRESISTLIDTGNNIFINWGSDIAKKIPNVIPAIVMGDIDDYVMNPPKNKAGGVDDSFIRPSRNGIIFLGGNHVSISAVVFKIFSETGYLQSLKEDENLPFLLALAIEYDTDRKAMHAVQNLNVLGRVMHLITFSRFHDLIESLHGDGDLLELLNLK